MTDAGIGWLRLMGVGGRGIPSGMVLPQVAIVSVAPA